MGKDSMTLHSVTECCADGLSEIVILSDLPSSDTTYNRKVWYLLKAHKSNQIREIISIIRSSQWELPLLMELILNP